MALLTLGLTDRALTCEDDSLLPAEFHYGLTNLVERPTVSSKGLARQEMRDAVPRLCAKIVAWKPRIVCLLGKQVAETILRTKVAFGLQETLIPGRLRCSVLSHRLRHVGLRRTFDQRPGNQSDKGTENCRVRRSTRLPRVLEGSLGRTAA